VPAEGNVLVEYDALIFQNSDEDWQMVAVSLSTAEPTTAAYPPMIEPIKVKVGAALPPSAKEDKSKDLKSEPMHSEPPQTNWSDKYRQGQVSQRAAALRGKEAQRELNVAAVSNQMLELEADRAGVQVMKEEAQRFARTEGVSVMYNLPGKFTIPGKTGQQQATVTAFTAKGDFTMIATPLLTNYVYLQAEIVNSSDSVLLAGPVNMYCDGSFVGKGELGLITIGGKITAGFGVDSQIKITRELQDKKIETAWKNHVETYHYRLAIENYKNSKVKLCLMDRIPYTEDTNLEIKDLQTDTPLSTDAEYLRTERNKGILRWDLELKPGTTGQNAKIITYNYTMKCGSEMKVQPAAD
jgi:uncharacterized protein (TIGR02231 family)